jgi:cytochrome c oxidase cbb3-type subunit 2
MIENAEGDLAMQGTSAREGADALLARYPKANIRAFTATGQESGRLTEADALIAYLQSLGTAIDFKLYDDKANIR